MTFKEAQLEAPSQGSTPRTAGSGATALKSENMTFSPIRQPTPSSLFNATVPQMQTTEMSIQMGQSNTSNKVPTDDTLATPPAPSLRAPQPVPLQPEAHSSRTQTPTTQGDSYINTGVSKMQNSKNDLRQLSAEDMNAPPSQKKTIGFVQKKRHDLQSATSNSGKHSSQYKIPGSPIRRRAPTGAVHHLQAQPLVIDISKTPEFLMSRPPVFKLKADDAFIC